MYGSQLDLTRKLLGDREFLRQLTAKPRARAAAIGKVVGLKTLEEESGIPMSTLSQAFSGERGRDVGLALLAVLAQHDEERILGNDVARLWGCEMQPLPTHSPLELRLLGELERFGNQGKAAIDRAMRGQE